MSEISKERAQEIFLGNGPEPTAQEERALARIALDWLALRERSEPVAELYAELYRLREDVKGPDGFATWKDAAIAEKAARVKYESLLNQRSRDIDYLTAMAAFHSDDWHKMSPITAYMHGWNARKASAVAVDSSVERDARRYRFLRDKDAFGDDAEPGLVSWDELTDLDLCDFDAAVDARLAAAGFEPLYTAPPAPVVAEPVSQSYKLPEWTNEQCLEFLTVAFRHAEIKGDFELDDLRLGVKMANAMTPVKDLN